MFGHEETEYKRQCRTNAAGNVSTPEIKITITIIIICYSVWTKKLFLLRLTVMYDKSV